MTKVSFIHRQKAIYAALDKILSNTPTAADQALFLNWGYVSVPGHPDAVSNDQCPSHQVNAAHIRLVKELVGNVSLNDTTLLDVGCGRGGALSVIAQRYKPRRLFGIDLCPEHIAFCRKNPLLRTARLQVADACQLPHPDHSFDILMNIESSGAYPDLLAFLKHVSRLLKPGGFFLYTDIVPVTFLRHLTDALAHLGLACVSQRLITPNILAARRQAFSAESRLLHAAQRTSEAVTAFLNTYSGHPDTPLFTAMEEGHLCYPIVHYQRTDSDPTPVPDSLKEALDARHTTFQNILQTEFCG